MNDIQISKYLALVLRHNPKDCGILLDNQGWTDLNILIQKLNDKGFQVNLDDIKRIVDTNSKKRFVIKDGKIKAAQGHSIEGIIAFDNTPKKPPELLYHGTTLEHWESGIKQQGLLKMNRHHVHLSTSISQANIVAVRWTNQKPIVLQVKALEMYNSNFQFFVSENCVWLTDHVPEKFISILLV